MTFLDCGFYAGNALKYYISKGMVNDRSTVYAFEANPEIKVDLDAFPVKIELIRKAVWIKNGTVSFHISGRHDAAGIKDLTGHTDPKEIKVPSVNFPKFVAGLPKDYIICSMDIEGAEFRVLKQMLKDGSITRFKILDVEFHHRLMTDYTSEDAEALVQEIEARGVKVKLKVDLR